jgi:hypothetical protein
MASMATTNQNANNNETIRRLLATYDPRRRRSSLIQYYQMHGEEAYLTFAAPLQGELRNEAEKVIAMMRGRKMSIPANPAKKERPPRSRPANILKAFQTRNQKSNGKVALRASFMKLPRGQVAVTAGRVRATRKQVTGDGSCLFYAVAQAMASRRQGKFLTEAELPRAGMELRKKVQFIQCQRFKSYFRGFLVDPHCQDILNPATYGGEPEILALALITQTPILVFEATSDPNVFIRRKPYHVYGLPTRNPPIFLVYSPGPPPNQELSAHYDLLHDVTVVENIQNVSSIEMVPGRENVSLFRQPGPLKRPRNGRVNGMNGALADQFTLPVPQRASSSFWGTSSFWGEAAMGVLMTLSCISSVVRLAR